MQSAIAVRSAKPFQNALAAHGDSCDSQSIFLACPEFGSPQANQPAVRDWQAVQCPRKRPRSRAWLGRWGPRQHQPGCRHRQAGSHRRCAWSRMCPTSSRCLPAPPLCPRPCCLWWFPRQSQLLAARSVACAQRGTAPQPPLQAKGRRALKMKNAASRRTPAACYIRAVSPADNEQASRPAELTHDSNAAAHRSDNRSNAGATAAAGGGGWWWWGAATDIAAAGWRRRRSCGGVCASQSDREGAFASSGGLQKQLWRLQASREILLYSLSDPGAHAA